MTSQQQLATLLQPALIRLIDQLRQQLTDAEWKWSYETLEVWPGEVSQETRSQYHEMMQALETADDDDAERIQDVLYSLPQPVPLYRLDVTNKEHDYSISMWQLCYRICLKDYDPRLKDMSIVPPDLTRWSIDPVLFDDSEAVDWAALNQKAQSVVVYLMEKIQSGEML